jgi:hypothetical protein
VGPGNGMWTSAPGELLREPCSPGNHNASVPDGPSGPTYDSKLSPAGPYILFLRWRHGRSNDRIARGYQIGTGAGPTVPFAPPLTSPARSPRHQTLPTVLQDLSVHGNVRGARQASGQTSLRAASTNDNDDLGAGTVLYRLSRFHRSGCATRIRTSLERLATEGG